MSTKKFVTLKEAQALLKKAGTEFVVIQNPGFVHPSFELSPLAPKITETRPYLAAAVMDMDGTTTTTEEICIHSLEYMVRKITGLLNTEMWQGLDKKKDYPHIIGNSTTKHIEYLIKTYGDRIRRNCLIEWYLYASLWTLVFGKDENRKHEVVLNLMSFGISDILEKNRFIQMRENPKTTNEELRSYTRGLAKIYSETMKVDSLNDYVRAGIDIYYQRYHELLAAIAVGHVDEVLHGFHLPEGKHWIEPMPGIPIFLGLVKGFLGADAWHLAGRLISQYQEKDPSATFNVKDVELQLRKLGLFFEKTPLKISIVTSSIFYEADIVMSEVFKVFREEIQHWEIPVKRKKKILNHFKHYKDVYNAFVTASDSNEIRLKPHRDLYSIALNHLNVPVTEFDKVIGFEDSESGTIAIRAAGIGTSVAVPFAHTAGHNLSAASHICPGGVAEVLLKHNLFLSI